MDATMIVAGSMIGSGIFIVSADIVRNVGGAGWLILVWLITGFMTLTAAVSYGELSGMFPKAGGQYVYLKEAYNPLVSFFIWLEFFCCYSNRNHCRGRGGFFQICRLSDSCAQRRQSYSPFSNRNKYLWISYLFYHQRCSNCFHLYSSAF